MPSRAPRRTVLAALAVIALAGCGAAPATPVASSPARTSPTAGPTVSPRREPSPTTPSPTPSGAAATTYANALTVADDGQISYTPLRWYQGRRAEDRCRKVGISSPTAWCHDYYYEKAGPAARAALADDTTFTLLDESGKPRTASAGQFRSAVADQAWPNFRLSLVGNQIQRVEQVYTP